MVEEQALLYLRCTQTLRISSLQEDERSFTLYCTQGQRLNLKSITHHERDEINKLCRVPLTGDTVWAISQRCDAHM